MPQEPEYWYRAVDRRYANYDPWAEFDQPSGSHLVIEMYKYEVKHHTPKGVKLIDGGYLVQVHGDSVKQFAVPTIELALKDLEARKIKHVRVAGIRLDRAKEHLAATRRML